MLARVVIANMLLVLPMLYVFLVISNLVISRSVRSSHQELNSS